MITDITGTFSDANIGISNAQITGARTDQPGQRKGSDL